MKKIILNLILIFMALSASGQTATNYYTRMEHIFGAIDKNKVTTGLLKEFGLRFNAIEAYNGSLNDTNYVDMTQWRSLYYSLYTMRVGTATQMPNPADLYAHFDNQASLSPNTILLAGLYCEYQQYKANAYTNGDVTVFNDRIFDVNGRNPYETKTAFVVAPLENYLKGNIFTFKAKGNMLYSNLNKNLANLAVDFGNGQGYQSINASGTKTITYPNGGEKTMNVRFTYSDGTILYSHSKLYVDYTPPLVLQRYDGNNIDEETITSTKTYQGVSGIGDITIEYSGTDRILDKPLIVVEGFDPDDSFDYDDLINRNDPGGLEINIGGGQTLNDAIEDEGKEIAFNNSVF